VPTHTVTLRWHDHDRVVTVRDDVEASIEGVDRRFYVVRDDDGRVRVSDGDRTVRATVVTDGTARWVFVDGTSVRFDASPRATRHGSRRGLPDTLAAPMPATVIKVLAVVGATVAPGDVLIVLEAMKMELPIRSPDAGIVARVHCREGDLVQPGIPLVELE